MLGFIASHDLHLPLVANLAVMGRAMGTLGDAVGYTAMALDEKGEYRLVAQRLEAHHKLPIRQLVGAAEGASPEYETENVLKWCCGMAGPPCCGVISATGAGSARARRASSQKWRAVPAVPAIAALARFQLQHRTVAALNLRWRDE